MTERILHGPFLLRQQAAERAGVSSGEILHRPDLLRVRGPWTPEVYFAFQFDEAGVRGDIGRVVMAFRDRFDDLAIADWLVRPNPILGGETPLASLAGGRGGERVRHAVAEASSPSGEGRGL